MTTNRNLREPFAPINHHIPWKSISGHGSAQDHDYGPEPSPLSSFLELLQTSDNVNRTFQKRASQTPAGLTDSAIQPMNNFINPPPVSAMDANTTAVPQPGSSDQDELQPIDLSSPMPASQTDSPAVAQRVETVQNVNRRVVHLHTMQPVYTELQSYSSSRALLHEQSTTGHNSSMENPQLGTSTSILQNRMHEQSNSDHQYVAVRYPQLCTTPANHTRMATTTSPDMYTRIGMTLSPHPQSLQYEVAGNSVNATAQLGISNPYPEKTSGPSATETMSDIHYLSDVSSHPEFSNPANDHRSVPLHPRVASQADDNNGSTEMDTDANSNQDVGVSSTGDVSMPIVTTSAAESGSGSSMPQNPLNSFEAHIRQVRYSCTLIRNILL